MGKAWLTFAEITAETGIHGNNLRRYAESFRKFLPSRVMNRARRFHRDTVPVFVHVFELFKQGLTTPEVEGRLAESFAPVLEAVALKSPEAQPPAELPANMLPAVRAAIGQALDGALAKIADQREQLGRLQADNAGLRDRLTVLEARVAQLASRRPAAGKVFRKAEPEARPRIMAIVSELREAGASFAQIAAHLNEKGEPTFSGHGRWQAGTVYNLTRKETKA